MRYNVTIPYTMPDPKIPAYQTVPKQSHPRKSHQAGQEDQRSQKIKNHTMPGPSSFRLFLQGLKPGEIGFCIASVGTVSASILLRNAFVEKRKEAERRELEIQREVAKSKASEYRQLSQYVDQLVASGAPLEGLSQIKFYRRRLRQQAVKELRTRDVTWQEVDDEWLRRRNAGEKEALEIDAIRLKLKRFWHSIEGVAEFVEADALREEEEREKSPMGIAVADPSSGALDYHANGTKGAFSRRYSQRLLQAGSRETADPVEGGSSSGSSSSSSESAAPASPATSSSGSGTSTSTADNTPLAGSPRWTGSRWESSPTPEENILHALLAGGSGKTEANDRLVPKTIMFLESLDRACCRNHAKCVWERDAPSFYSYLRTRHSATGGHRPVTRGGKPVSRIPKSWPGPYQNDDDFDAGSPPTNSPLYDERRIPKSRFAQRMAEAEGY